MCITIAVLYKDRQMVCDITGVSRTNLTIWSHGCFEYKSNIWTQSHGCFEYKSN